MLPGGIIGVDLFFVLSGFLITSLLLERRATGDTSVARFYRRRALRLIPPLVLMLLATNMAAELTNPGHWHLVAVSTLSTLLYGANWAQVHGKFEIEYLHVWSLAIEEQFYIVWAPLVLWLLAKQVRERVIMEVSALAALTVAMWRLHLIRVAPFAMVYPRTDARLRTHSSLGQFSRCVTPAGLDAGCAHAVVRVAGLCRVLRLLGFDLHTSPAPAVRWWIHCSGRHLGRHDRCSAGQPLAYGRASQLVSTRCDRSSVVWDLPLSLSDLRPRRPPRPPERDSPPRHGTPVVRDGNGRIMAVGREASLAPQESDRFRQEGADSLTRQAVRPCRAALWTYVPWWAEPPLGTHRGRPGRCMGATSRRPKGRGPAVATPIAALVEPVSSRLRID